MDRRDFGRAVATLTAWWWLESGCGKRERLKTHHELPTLEAPPPSRTRDPGAPELTLFGPRELPTVAAVLDQLLPAAHGLPSATQARVHVYLDRELSKPQFSGPKALVLRGLAVIDALAKERGGGKRLHELPGDARDDLLARMQRGDETAGGFDSARWFELTLTLALEGYLGDPRHGGNHGQVVWNAIGLQIQCPGGHE
jgi:gluconate 2-dehydrogenase gamma chain